MKNKLQLIAILLFTFVLVINSQTKRPLTLEDVMKFKQIKEVAISDYGNWISYVEKIDRGNSELKIKSLNQDKIITVECGTKAVFSDNEKWVSVFIEPDFMELEKNEKDKPKNNLELVNLFNEEKQIFNEAKSADFTKNSEWVVIHFYEKKDTSKNAKPKKNLGSQLIIKKLTDIYSDTLMFASSYAIDSLSNFIAYTISDTNKTNNGLYFYDLKNRTKIEIDLDKNSFIDGLNWNKRGALAYVKTFLKKDEKKDSAEVKFWKDDKIFIVADSKSIKNEWYVPSENKLNWSNDGTKLFYGIKPTIIKDKKEEKDSSKKNPYDYESILSKKEVDVWHWNDPLIKPNEVKEWKNKEKFTYTTLYDINTKKIIYLTDKTYPYLTTNKNNSVGLIRSDNDYLKLRTWDGNYSDYYAIDLNTGRKHLIEVKLSDRVQLSPDGKYVVYFYQGNWFIYSVKEQSTKNLTEKLKVSFADEDNDTPSEPNSYGIGGWIKNDKYVLLYDKYDIWQFNTQNGDAICLTKNYGRENNLIFRIQNLDKDRDYYFANEELLLTAFHNSDKSVNYFLCNINSDKVNRLTNENKRVTSITKAKKADKFVFTTETYNEYPDLWISNLKLENQMKVTNLGNQLNEFLWGTSKLIEFHSIDGKQLQGAVILPENFEDGKRYPVLVYFYEISSHRVHEFTEMVVNHRPNFPFYASNGYIIFLPDVKFDISRPGYSATKCIVPGVQKLIDLGWADPKGIALHGHSWGGYQTAFMVTQTDMFACAIAGAPVGNMTSAYSGIRWGTGLARQFQYEKSQSRIGGTLWEKPMSFIENSPVFFADKINTPLLLMHGDDDDAVPWYQSIEIYLAMRRLEKDCIFLQYRKEPHHPRKYPNKLDYSIKMKEYLDYYCKRTVQPEWIKKGVPYSGK